jgi:hypothetical protein
MARKKTNNEENYTADTELTEPVELDETIDEEEVENDVEETQELTFGDESYSRLSSIADDSDEWN